jgi:hypothetical protein
MAYPLHRQAGVTIEQLHEKRISLMDKLSAQEQLGHFSRDYGAHDPRIAPFPACSCGAPGLLTKSNSSNGTKWMASCSICDKRIRDAQQYDWSACFMWCQLNLDQLDYRTIPLFALCDLDPVEAKARMAPIYHDLLLRCQIATLDSAICDRTKNHPAPGRDYIERISAYRDLAKLILRLIKEVAPIRKSK